MNDKTFLTLLLLFPGLLGIIFLFKASWIIALICLLTVLEILFLGEKNKPKKDDNLIKFTAKRKLFNLGTTISLVGSLGLIAVITKKVLPTILTLLLVVGIVGGLLGLVYLYIWLNSFKYRKDK